MYINCARSNNTFCFNALNADFLFTLCFQSIVTHFTEEQLNKAIAPVIHVVCKAEGMNKNFTSMAL